MKEAQENMEVDEFHMLLWRTFFGSYVVTEASVATSSSETQCPADVKKMIDGAAKLCLTLSPQYTLGGFDASF